MASMSPTRVKLAKSFRMLWTDMVVSKRLANIAGGPMYLKRVDELTWEEWKQDLDRNIKGTFLFCRDIGQISWDAREAAGSSTRLRTMG